MLAAKNISRCGRLELHFPYLEILKKLWFLCMLAAKNISRCGRLELHFPYLEILKKLWFLCMLAAKNISRCGRLELSSDLYLHFPYLEILKKLGFLWLRKYPESIFENLGNTHRGCRAGISDFRLLYGRPIFQYGNKDLCGNQTLSTRGMSTVLVSHSRYGDFERGDPFGIIGGNVFDWEMKVIY